MASPSLLPYLNEAESASLHPTLLPAASWPAAHPHLTASLLHCLLSGTTSSPIIQTHHLFMASLTPPKLCQSPARSRQGTCHMGHYCVLPKAKKAFDKKKWCFLYESRYYITYKYEMLTKVKNSVLDNAFWETRVVFYSSHNIYCNHSM